MFKNEEYSSFLNIFICLVLKHDKFTSFVSLFRPLGYPIKPQPYLQLIDICMQLFAGELTNQNRECYKVNDNTTSQHWIFFHIRNSQHWIFFHITISHHTVGYFCILQPHSIGYFCKIAHCLHFSSNKHQI